MRNERRTLAAVTGHPFTMALIESFSDEQCLYLLVRILSSLLLLSLPDMHKKKEKNDPLRYPVGLYSNTS